MSDWEDVNDSASPFEGVAEVDGLVYAEQDLSPELRAQPTSLVTPQPVHRPAPVRPQTHPAGEWNPGGKVNPAQFRIKPDRPNIIKVLLIGLIPVAIVVGVLYFVMTQYGMLPK